MRVAMLEARSLVPTPGTRRAVAAVRQELALRRASALDSAIKDIIASGLTSASGIAKELNHRGDANALRRQIVAGCSSTANVGKSAHRPSTKMREHGFGHGDQQGEITGDRVRATSKITFCRQRALVRPHLPLIA
jgi:hypothetical protein